MRGILETMKASRHSAFDGRRARGSGGQALLMVLAVTTLLVLLPAIVLEATNNGVPITLQAQNSKAALAAAEAGAAAYLSQLSADPSYTRYNDVTCNSPSPANGFYLAGSTCAQGNGGTTTPNGKPNIPAGIPAIPAGAISSDWVPVSNTTSMPEYYVYTVTDQNPSSPKSPLELIVTGCGGTGCGTANPNPGLDRYRTLDVQLTSQLTSAIFSNYNTASPYTYADSQAFTLLQDGVNLALSAIGTIGGGSIDGIPLGGMKAEIESMLGSGPTGNIKLGQLFCAYHSYQPNPVADIVQEGLAMAPTLVTSMLGPKLGSFDPLGLPIGQALLSVISSITSAVTSAMSTALFSANFLGNLGQTMTIDGHTFYPWTGPFPLLCNVSELYGSSSSSYYGLSTKVTGPVYSNDQFYACTSNNGASNALTGDTVKIGAAGLLPTTGPSTGPQLIPADPAPGGAFTLDNLPAISFTVPIINYTFNISTGCSNQPTDVAAVAPEPTPVPDFAAMAANATCNFYGPTFIDFQGGTADIWSPDTAEMGGSGCGGSTNGAYTVPSSSNGTVLYVHNLPENQTCQPFPSIFALPFGPTTPIQDHSCYWGDALVQGSYSGDWTIGASNDIVITGSVIAQGGSMQKSSLGLAPGGNVPISEPSVGSSGVFYPQGNVVVNHPVVNGQNDNNCSFLTEPAGAAPGGLPATCSPGIPTSIQAPPPPQQCSFSITAPLSYLECLLDDMYEGVDSYMYNIVQAGYDCGMGSQAAALIDLSGCTGPTSGGLYENAGVSNTNPTAVPTPTFSGSPPSNCSSTSDWSLSFLPSGCVVSYFDYYWAFGSEAGTAFNELCSLFSGACPNVGGYESKLATWEASWVHGPLNSFPAIYNPIIDADILASNSSSQVTGASFTPASTPQNITNGSFTVQNLDSGNSGSYSRAGHGLGTLTENGAIVESYANGLANAGLTTNHFHLFDSSCVAAADFCYVSTGYHQVNINYSPDVVLNPPPYLVQELQGVNWVSQVTEMTPGQVITGI